MTRAGMIWVAVIGGLVVLVFLIIFILQNQDRVTVNYFGAAGELSLGMALFIAAVAGGILVAIAGATRILQLRNQRRHPSGPQPAASGTPAAPRATTAPGAPPARRPGSPAAAPPTVAPRQASPGQASKQPGRTIPQQQPTNQDPPSTP